jgi:hypothetical protein
LLNIFTAALWEGLILTILLAMLLYSNNSMAWGLVFQMLSGVSKISFSKISVDQILVSDEQEWRR